MKIALDAMGGDNGLAPIIAGGLQAIQEYGVEIAFVGQRNAIECALAQHTYDPAQVEIVHADQVIEMHEEPSAAVHARRDASVVSAHNWSSGPQLQRSSPQGTRVPLWPAAQLFLGRLHGVRRAALGTDYPTLHGECLVLDGGATTRLQARKPLSIGIMGHAYAQACSASPTQGRPVIQRRRRGQGQRAG